MALDMPSEWWIIMDNIFKILLVEDDVNSCEEFVECVNTLPDFQLIGITNSSKKAIDSVQQLRPHAIILDLELHRGSGSGLDVLRELPSLNLKYLPYVVVTTNNTSNVTYELARTLGADYIFYKHESDYSAKKVIELIKLAVNIKKATTATYERPSIDELSEEERLKCTMVKLQSELNMLGLNPKTKGYKYIPMAIKSLINNPNESVYQAVSKLTGSSAQSIEKAIQNTINKAWRTTDPDILFNSYTARIDIKRGAPTTMEFLHYYANKYRDNY